MPECVMLLASAKFLAGRRYDFKYRSKIRLSVPPHNFSLTDN